MTHTDLSCDILIIGGGLVGGTLGCALAKHGLKTVVVDVEEMTDMLDVAFDGRCSAIAQSSQKVLEAVGLWDVLGPTANPMDDIHVTDGDSLVFLHYDHTDIGDQPFGWMVENRMIRQALFEVVPTLENLTVIAPDRVESLERDATSATATLKSGQTIRASMAIGCDGRGSKTRDDANIKLTSWSYKQVGIVCTVEHERPHNNIAHEHFLPSGPFAILPLKGTDAKPGCQSSLVWTEREDLAPILMKLDEDDFVEELKLRFGDFLGDVKVVGSRFAYPLSLQFAEESTGQRLALAGDASHGMHPIAGQGLNMGLRDVAVLAEVLVDAHRLGLDVGDAFVLEKYEQGRRFDNHLMLAMTDVLNRLFSNNITPLKLARDVGLAIVEEIPPVKKFFMRHAMGTVGDLPRMMRGKSL